MRTQAVDDHGYEHVDVEVTHGTKGHVQGVLEHSCPDADQQVVRIDPMYAPSG